MTVLAANLSMLQEIVDCAAGVERILAEQVDALDARARRVQSVWTGTAADEYSAVHARWASGARDMHAALAAVRQIVTTAHGNYASAVSANLAMWP
jgi:WXG100 family type VII secretion target